MLLVRDSMTREVVTLSPRATAGEALALCRERRIRHLPVVEGGRLIGLVSDRDLRSATPALGDPERATALNEIKVVDHMSREVVTALPDDPIELAAKSMREERVGCLPVMNGEGIAGIITTSDVVEAMMHLVGVYEPGSRVEVVMPESPDSLVRVAEILRANGAKVLSVLASPERGEPDGERVAVFRLETINPGNTVDELQRAGFPVRWPPSKDSAAQTREGGGQA